MREHKLYTLTSPDFEAYSHLTPEGRIVTKSADNIPLLRWPDNRWCWPANIYMSELYEKGCSRKENGGTLKTYATQISHLIRFCSKNKVDFNSLTDDQFTFFMKSLAGERRPDGALIREADSAIAIGRTCLDFLCSVGNSFDIQNFVGPKGHILADRREFKILGAKSNSRVITKTYWHHRSFPTPEAKKRRLPIDSLSISKLRDAVLSASATIFIRKRRYVMLRLLEIIGARRSEISTLKVSSVKDASKMEKPMLKLLTMKKGGNSDHSRLVPILRHDVNFLLEFIEKNRHRVIKKTVGTAHDDGYVLISETTGRRLRANTITQEMRILRIHAKLTSKACAHMFRHRYITKLFIALIEQHCLENEDQFRRALIDNEYLKHQIKEFTGQTRIESLDNYIHLAFTEISRFAKTINLVNATRLIESLEASLSQVQAELKQDGGTSEVIERINRFLSSALADLSMLDYEK